MSHEDMTDVLNGIDKRTADFSLRIPEITKCKLESLSPAMKRTLNDKILLLVDRTIHESEYVPGKYLKSED